MKHLTEHLWFETRQRRDYLNITDTVAQLVRKSGVQEGLCLVNAMHITASVYINDAEGDPSAAPEKDLAGLGLVVDGVGVMQPPWRAQSDRTRFHSVD